MNKQIEALKLDNQSLSLIEMSYSQRLKSWENYRQIIESQIADIEKRMIQYNQDIRAETNLAKRTQLNKQMDIYST